MARCESCGIPLRQDPQGGGTNADGSRSDQYCSYCYRDGEFVDGGDDVAAFQAMVVEKMVAHGWWRIAAWVMTRGIPRLPRWSKKG